MKKRILAIIPARGGSKRIPGKNIKDFLGKPVIAYSIQAALKCKLFDEVMVSTDDDAIAKIALQYGAVVPFRRSKKNSDDHATTMDIIMEVLDTYKQESNKEFDLVCCIYPAAPLVKPGHLAEGLQVLEKKDLTSVSPVVAYGSPVWRGVEIDNSGKVKMLWPEFVNSRSQDLKKGISRSRTMVLVQCSST